MEFIKSINLVGKPTLLALLFMICLLIAGTFNTTLLCYGFLAYCVGTPCVLVAMFFIQNKETPQPLTKEFSKCNNI